MLYSRKKLEGWLYHPAVDQLFPEAEDQVPVSGQGSAAVPQETVPPPPRPSPSVSQKEDIPNQVGQVGAVGLQQGQQASPSGFHTPRTLRPEDAVFPQPSFEGAE